MSGAIVITAIRSYEEPEALGVVYGLAALQLKNSLDLEQTVMRVAHQRLAKFPCTTTYPFFTPPQEL